VITESLNWLGHRGKTRLLLAGVDPCIENNKGCRVIHTCRHHVCDLVKGQSNIVTGIWKAGNVHTLFQEKISLAITSPYIYTGHRAFSVAGRTVWNSTGQSPRPGCQQQQLQATTQDGLLQPLLSTLGAVEMLHDSAIYK